MIAWLIGPWRSATSAQATTGHEQLLEPISAGTDEERTP
jgi:hypothetical protein